MPPDSQFHRRSLVTLFPQSGKIAQFPRSVLRVVGRTRNSLGHVFCAVGRSRNTNFRWKIFRIVNAGLKDTTIPVWKTQQGNKTFESNLQKETDDDGCNDDND